MLNRSSHIVFSLILLFTVAFSACKKDTPTDPPVPCTTAGHLEVRVCDQTQTNFFGGAEVFLYNTAVARDADVSRTNQLDKKLTGSVDPNTTGATFYFIAPQAQTFYFYARWTNGTLNFSGKGDAFVTTCNTTIVSCKVS